MLMTSITAALLVLLLSPTLWASREGSEAAATSHLGTSTEAQAEAQAERAFEMLNKKLRECQSEEDRSQGQLSTEAQAKKMGKCISQIKKFADQTTQQRMRSEEANKKYANAYVAAQKFVKYLQKNLEKNAEKFNMHRQNEETHVKEVNEMLQSTQDATRSSSTREDLGSMLSGSRGSLLSMQTGQVPMMGYQAMAPQPMAAQPVAPQAWGDMAAMFTPGGQNFGVPGSLVGRRPSLLQLGQGAPGTPMGNLQARLDREANMLEADESAF